MATNASCPGISHPLRSSLYGHGEDLRYTGVLLGTNDVVYMRARAPTAGRELHIATWNSEPNLDADVCVQCGTTPTPTTFLKRGFTNYEELITVTSSECASPNDLWIAMHSYIGSGRFDIVVSQAKPTYSVDVIVESEDPVEIAMVSDTLEALSKRMYAISEGQLLMVDYKLHTASPGSVPESWMCAWQCPGYCDLCFVREGGNSFAPIPGSPPAVINFPAWDDPSKVAHEMGHTLFDLRDEYVGGTIDTCGHSVMGNSWHPTANLCVAHNQGDDHDPLGWPTGEPPGWSAAAWLLPLAYSFVTPDPYNYDDHDFNNQITVTVQ